MKLPILAPLLCVCACHRPPQALSTPPDAAVLHQDALVIDTHIDGPYHLFNEGGTWSQRLGNGDFDLVCAREGGLDASFQVAFVANSFNRPGTHPEAQGGAWEQGLALIDFIKKEVEAHPEQAGLATSPSELEAIVASGRHAVVIALENGAPLDGHIERVADLYTMGVRYITLAHAWDNHLSDASYDERHSNGGLTVFGEQVVVEMNRIGMLIDTTHLSDDAFWQIMEISTKPVLATHSCLRHFREMERNISDEMLVALAENGGVLHLNFGSWFLTDGIAETLEARKQALEGLGAQVFSDEEERQAAEQAIRDSYADRLGTVDDLLDQIDYAVALVGAEHVGLGSDFDGVGDTPLGLEDVSSYPHITEGLLARGYNEEDIRKILGGNLLRVWRENGERE